MVKSNSNLTEVVQIRVPLTQEQKLGILADVSKANDRINEIAQEIDDLKEQTATLKDAQKREYDNISQLLADNKVGYILENHECTVLYGEKTVTFYDAKTGEKLEERPIEESEQIRLSEHRTDAEKIIRDSSREE